MQIAGMIFQTRSSLQGI
ncbi:DUF6783 domain-containing protein [Blautia wexlerae]|nr:DUF6783 domain-containing protein [Blautia wexlerae]MEE0556172.1 DUF6783 domain-containing protein [Blautia wexlerae]